MLKRYHQVVGGTFRIIDAVVIAASWLISYWLRFYLPLIQVTKGFPRFDRYAALTPLVVVLWVLGLSALGTYRPRGMLRRTHEVHLLLKGHLLSMLMFIALTYLFSEYKYSRGVMVYFGVLGAFFLVFCRLVLRNALRAAKMRGFQSRKLIAIGQGPSLETLIGRLDKFPELGYRVVGVVADPSFRETEVRGKPVLGSYDDIREVVRNAGAEGILIVLPRSQSPHTDRILKLLADETIDIQIVPDVHEYVTLGCEVEDFDGIPLVHLNDSPLQGWPTLLKRATDIILSGFALLVLSPVLAAVALAVKLSSPGPVLYRQERMGLDGRTFWMLKFRSMRTDAEAATGAVWAIPNDDRRTAIGTFLRSTSLDELPQFWNVFRGDMSLVGPRPERPVFVQQFRGDIPHYMLRHKVKAGITGWAQVNGWRGNTSLSRRIECDLYYIRNWSYVLDLKILVMTLWKGFVNKNAY